MRKTHEEHMQALADRARKEGEKLREKAGLSPPECHGGYPMAQLERELGMQSFRRFQLWMNGQTMMVCEGRRYDPLARAYEPDECADHPHGGVAYTWDVDRWLQAGPIID